VNRRLPHVDRVGVEERAAQLGKRSIKTTAKEQGIRLAVSILDLTTLEGADTAGKVRHLCAKAVCPAPTLPEIPSVAAICVYPSLVSVAREALRGTGVRTASVAAGFPAGQVSLEAKLRDTEDAVAAGEIDNDRAQQQLEDAQAELAKLDAGDSTSDRWQLEQRIRHAENQLAVAGR